MSEPSELHAARLEALWQGDFGDAYTERNSSVAAKRGPFWHELLSAFPCQRVLEVGCNLGANLQWLAGIVPPREVYGIDVNESALTRVRATLPAVNPMWGKARELPFRDGYFDLVFTCGVLIHQPPDTLPEVMSEVVRCSRHYVLAAEYFADELTEVPYRDQPGSLFKMNFGRLYQEQHPALRLVRTGFLSRAEGWDDLTFWLFDKSA
jgi:pseudaminic acid biosynthesis-associated methylase